MSTIEKVEEENRFWINNGCPAGRYLCNGTLDLCVRLENVCDKRVDCPNRDDEDWTICKNWPKYKQTEYSGVDNKLQAVDGEHQEVDNGKDNGNTDSFEGQGFMFHVDNLVIYNSDVKMFDQSSDNVKTNNTIIMS
ncbi:unnamed protein product [Medioppia subpectinata]|uniref:Uncharacterized protein n=1 Tax=Medioppia subpectinata TaxID=1979941 RepID=A0A7R9KKE3_9ACAR|nr:unnamed protein product [Medioppia subpectinata]CAG2105203.1 unnamed protein product [Medioppia subpectinata]